MVPSAVVKAEISPDRGTSLRDAGIGPQVDLLVFDGPPESFDEDIVAPGPFAIHADLYLPAGQNLDEVVGGGARRVWRDVLEEGFACGLHRIERLIEGRGSRVRFEKDGEVGTFHRPHPAKEA